MFDITVDIPEYHGAHRDFSEARKYSICKMGVIECNHMCQCRVIHEICLQSEILSAT
jgi:hypothetical protein